MLARGADLLNEDFRRCQYAVRGELYLAAENLRKAGREIIFTNVGNPQALGQKPITFNRQVTTANAASTCSCRSSWQKTSPAGRLRLQRRVLKQLHMRCLACSVMLPQLQVAVYRGGGNGLGGPRYV